ARRGGARPGRSAHPRRGPRAALLLAGSAALAGGRADRGLGRGAGRGALPLCRSARSGPIPGRRRPRAARGLGRRPLQSVVTAFPEGSATVELAEARDLLAQLGPAVHPSIAT